MTQEVRAKKALLTSFRKELNAAGISEKQTQTIMEKISSRHLNGGLKTFPRDIVKLAASRITRPKQGVYIRWLGGKKFRVISEDGHKALRDSIRKHKPWEKNGAGGKKVNKKA